MELRYLRYFATVADLRSFSRAAEMLHVAQSAISQQIKTLEAELEVKLLVRTKRSVGLTAAGLAFLREAEDILSHAERAKLAARRAANGEVGSLSIGCFSAGSSHFLPALIQEYRSRYPNVRVHLSDLTPVQQIQAFARGGIDVGFTRALPANRAERFVQERVYRDRPIVAVPQGHTAGARGNIRLGDLGGDDWVFFKRSEAPELVDGFLQLCTSAGFSPKPVSEPATMQTVLMMVAAGVGVSIVPGCVRCFQQPGVRFIPIRPSPPPIDLMAVRPEGEAAPAVANLLMLLRERLPEVRKTYETP